MSENKNAELGKELVGSWAIHALFQQGVLRDGIRLGMGTGTTVKYVIESLFYLWKDERFKDIAVVPTSSDTFFKCRSFGIPTYSLDSKRVAGHLDLCIDGADRYDKNNNLIKGGGGALFREKIVAYNSDIFVVVAEDKKKVESLNCDFPVPIEVLPFAYKAVCLALEQRGLTFELRTLSDENPYITENGNYIIDAHYPKDLDISPEREEIELNKIVGVVENGFFNKTKVKRIFSTSEIDEE